MNLHTHIYRVADRLSYVEDESWYEYEVTLRDSEGYYIDGWDSLYETYNGETDQALTQRGAEAAVAEIEEDVEAGNYQAWFDAPVFEA
jgi:hypothetical protein